MRKNISFIMALALLLLLGGYIVAMSSPNYELNWLVPVSSGGSGSVSSTTFVADLTIGQTAIGRTNSDGYEIELGYWPGVQSAYQLFLPIVVNP